MIPSATNLGQQQDADYHRGCYDSDQIHARTGSQTYTGSDPDGGCGGQPCHFFFTPTAENDSSANETNSDHHASSNPGDVNSFSTKPEYGHYGEQAAPVATRTRVRNPAALPALSR